ncbi:RNA 2'-phosphotransferase [Ramlibacter alkalitolerans]|uniref:Probable RNA 2'-phosphotransferase n=1 Tax=Ramlibacter alkalitolerans TaxID=2039631 RepID=A0ABS1JTU8_9BURK|nr:RNA 2'-phosphotransferase [Ramlibacter alkalitolerans]
MVEEDQLVSVSKLLAKVLRHEPELAGLRLDSAGWVRIDDLLHGLAKAGRAPTAAKRLRTAPRITRELVEKVVAGNDKGRFAISEDGQRIRAVQGHSLEVDLGHPVLEPPASLFHGTAWENWGAIAKEGLKPMGRHAVHLYSDAKGALRTGSRHGRAVVLEVAASRMHQDGYEFSLADNGVWLVSDVPAQYLKAR